MNTKIFGNIYLLTKISNYLNPNEIISFSACNKTINEHLNPSNNRVINNIFYNHVGEQCFETDYEFENINKKKRDNILDNSWNSNINWKLYLSNIFQHFKIYPDKKISTMVLDSFKSHLYLPDLRKQNNNLEFAYSSLHQIDCYDRMFKESCNYNFYGNYINNNYIINHGNGCEIKILKKGSPFENELKQFINIYDEIIANNEYKYVINSIISYDFEKMEEIYENSKKNRNQINNIIFFILWANKSFIMYCNYLYDNIHRLEDNKDEKKFLNEYINSYNNYTNSSLLINHNFGNVNFIINYLNDFILNKNTSEKFSLYELSRKIFKKKIYDKLYEKINNKTSLLYKNILINKINNPNEEIEIEDEIQDNEMDDTNDTSSDCDMSIDDSILENKQKNDIEILENIFNSVLDIVINKNNGKAINHYRIKLGEEYENLENIIIKTTLETLEEYLTNGEKSSLELTEILNKLFKYEDNSINLKCDSNSFKLINRTKKNILEQSLKFMFRFNFKNILKDFNSRLRQNNNNNGRTLFVTNNEIMNKKEYKYDLSEFNDKKKMKIEGKIEEDLKNIKLCLYEQNINGYDVQETNRLVNQYMENNGIDIVLLMKKMVFIFIKENELYEEKAQKICNFFNKRGNENTSLNDLIKL